MEKTISYLALLAVSKEGTQSVQGFKLEAPPLYPSMAISRDMELRIHGHLREIGLVNDDLIGGRQGFPSSIAGYERSLRSVAECATQDEVDEVAEYIKSTISEEGERPTNRTVRRRARTIVSKAGYPANEFLNTA